MKKTLVLMAVAALWQNAGAQTATNTFPNTGNAGIGTTSPAVSLQIGNGVGVLSGGGTSGLLMKFTGTGPSSRAVIELHDPAGLNRLSLLSAANNAFIGSVDKKPLLLNAIGGNVGINTNATEDALQVNSSYNKVVIGSAFGSGLNYGTGYIGLNASRDNSIIQNNSTWKTTGDGAHNGGCAIFGDISGNMYFSTIASNGTTDQVVPDATVNASTALKIHADGNVQIGLKTSAAHATAKLSVDGTIVCKDFYVTALADWPDYVFAPVYKLTPLQEIQAYYQANKHLPNVPTAAEINEKGINVGDMQKIQMEKIEELFLHVVALNEKVEALQKENAALKLKSGN